MKEKIIIIAVLLLVVLFFYGALHQAKIEDLYQAKVRDNIGKRVIINKDTLIILDAGFGRLYLPNNINVPYEQFAGKIVK